MTTKHEGLFLRLRRFISVLSILCFGLAMPGQSVAQFADVPTDYWAYEAIGALDHSDITRGCGDGTDYCPGSSVTRAQMAVFLVRGVYGADYVPPAASGTVFGDVSKQSFGASYIEELYLDGITAGCGDGRNYCPSATVTRDQMAILLLRAKHGASYQPPPAKGVFNDVSLSHWTAPWIEQLAIEGITSGCGSGKFCPGQNVTRAQMAVFLVRTFSLSFAATASGAHYDVVVVGGSPSGVAAAVTVAERGRTIALISQTRTVGGSVSNGLGASDVGSVTAITGFQARFFDAVKAFYGDLSTVRVAPGDAETIFLDFLVDAGVTVETEVDLIRVDRTGGAIKCIDTTAGRFCAQTFIDATYAGDLAAASGAPYRLGYGDFYAYGEPYTLDRRFTLHGKLSTASGSGALTAFSNNPFVGTGPRDPYPLVSDDGMPSMTFRPCVTRQVSNRVAFGRSRNYETYADSWRRWVQAYFATHGARVTVSALGTINSAAYQIAKTTSTKWDMNSGFGSFMNVPIPMEYFTGDRNSVIALFAEYHRDFLHFLKTDPVVPTAIRSNFVDFGLCADEFADNGSWPYEPYVREGRRIIGHDLLSTKNIYVKDRRINDEPIAIGAYNLDSKHSMIFYHDGEVWRDTGEYLSTPLYEVPRGVMHPVGIDNLIVSVAISATPRAYGSVRMEPQFMALGEAAGAIAYVAYLHNNAANAVPYSSVRYILNQNRAQVSITALCQSISAKFREANGFDSETCAPSNYTPLRR